MSEIRNLFAAGVTAVQGHNAVREYLTQNADSGEAVDGLAQSIWLVAVGKAASSMCLGAADALGDRLQRGLLITKYDHTDASVTADSRFECLESAHPVPDQASLDAGDALTAFVGSVPAGSDLLVLLSGGASALVEKLPASMTLADLSRVNEYLLANGLDIGSMNVVRKSISCIKGGRLAGFIDGTCVLQLAISDVPGDSLAVIGSGLMTGVTDSQAQQHSGKITSINGLELPEWLRAFQSSVSPAPLHSDPVFAQITSHIIASSALAQAAVRNAATQLGLPVVPTLDDLNADVQVVAERVSSTLLAADAADGVYCWGGEPTLILPASPGRGGRNQHLAVLLAKALAGHDGIEVLVCGTDGTDGPTADAGGLVNGSTMARASALGLVADDYLMRADAGNFLEQVDALVTTGPTGTNVMDLVIAIKSVGKETTVAT